MWLPDDDQEGLPGQNWMHGDRDHNDDTDQSWIGGWFLIAAMVLVCGMLAFCTRLHA